MFYLFEFEESFLFDEEPLIMRILIFGDQRIAIRISFGCSVVGIEDSLFIIGFGHGIGLVIDIVLQNLHPNEMK